MDRNDQIFFSAIGGTLAVAVLIAAIAIYGTSQTAAEWTQSLLTGFAVIVAIVVPWWWEAQRRELSHRIAEVTVASALRSWLRVAAEGMGQNHLYTTSDSHDGERNIEIPSFEIQTVQIAAMRRHYAREVLSLCERRARRQNDIYSARFYHDDDDGLIEYYEQIAHLFWSARRIYTEIARDHGLDEFTNRPSELATVRHVAKLANEYRDKERNRSNEEIATLGKETKQEPDCRWRQRSHIVSASDNVIGHARYTQWPGSWQLGKSSRRPTANQLTSAVPISLVPGSEP